MLPNRADVTYKLNMKFWMGFRFDVNVTERNLNEQNYGNNSVFVSKASKKMAPYLRFKLSKSLYINTKFGYARIRNYRVINADDKINLAVTSNF